MDIEASLIDNWMELDDDKIFDVDELLVAISREANDVYDVDELLDAFSDQVDDNWIELDDDKIFDIDELLVAISREANDVYDVDELLDAFSDQVDDNWMELDDDRVFDVDELFGVLSDEDVDESPGVFSDEVDELLFGQLVGTADPQTNGTRQSASKSAVKELLQLRVCEELMKASNDCCPVCQDEFELQEDVTLMPCSHVYHPTCLLPWLELHNTCPSCRYELPTDDNQNMGSWGSGNRPSTDYVDAMLQNPTSYEVLLLFSEFDYEAMAQD